VKTRAPTVDEIRRVLDVAPQKRRLVYEVGLCTGLRKKELRSILVRHLDTKLGGLVLDGDWTKNGNDGFQPLPSELVSRLANAARGKPPTAPLLHVPTHTARDLDKDLEKAGVPKRTEEGKIDFHGARRAFCTLLLELGANPAEVQALMRHSDPVTTMGIYARARNARLGDLAEQVGRVVLGSGTDDTSSGSGAGGSVASQLESDGETEVASPDTGQGSDELVGVCQGGSIPPASTNCL
jgi:integrase